MPPRMESDKQSGTALNVLVTLVVIVLLASAGALSAYLRATGHRVEPKAQAQQAPAVSPQRFLKHVSYAWDGKVCYSIFYPQANTYFQPIPVKDSACGH